MVINSVIKFLSNNICLDVIVIGFFVVTIFNCVVFALKRKGGLEVKIKLLLRSISVNLLEVVILTLTNNLVKNYAFVLLNLATAFTFFSYLEVKVKKQTISKTQKEFIRSLDEKIYNVKEVPTVKICKSIKKEEPQVNNEPDFSHVKNVLERLNYYNLSIQEKRQLENLKEDLVLAENGNLAKQSSVNEGLGILLKIMAKYKV